MGKTSLANNIAVNVASPSHGLATGDGVMIFSLEMQEDELAGRAVCAEGRVDGSKLNSPKFLSDADWQRLTSAAKTLYPLPIWVDDSNAITPSQISAKIRRRQAEYNQWDEKSKSWRRRLRLVVVDYMQLLRAVVPGTGDRTIRSREEEISYISRSLKGIAKDLGVAVLSLSAMNRDVEKRSTVKKVARPQLSDLRESGAIESDADGVVFIHREDYYDPDTPDRNIAELIVAKNRGGPTGVAKVRFDREYTRFDNLADGEYVDGDAA
jgi:replicative DNA helicase